ncbi:MAG TPA: hypothetical protein VKB34_19065 [Povalibacter sp.]|nr:hypothetical protein [Povalibacter sp.]
MTRLLIVVVAAIALSLWLRSRNDVLEAVLAMFGWPRQRLASHLSLTHAAGVLVAVALLVVLNPELRVLLLFVDAVGIDVVLLLVLLQLQVNYALVRRVALGNFWHRICNWGPMPFSAPTLNTLKKHLVLTVCAAASPALSLFILGSMTFAACASAQALLSLRGR